MDIAFLTNYYNYHQAQLAECFSQTTSGHFYFIVTAKMDDDRRKMGWDDNCAPDFVLDYGEKKAQCDDIIEKCDAIIIGSAPLKMIKSRLKKKKLVFLYRERIDKKAPKKIQLFESSLLLFHLFGKYKNIYCLSASAFTAYDFSKRHCLKGKCYKWGYFPKVEHYDIEKLTAKEIDHVPELLFVGRMIDWKHPELPLKVAEKLKSAGVSFHLSMIGTGEMENEIRNQIEDLHLHDQVNFLGPMKPDQVREYMHNADIFLFTSDRGEGWGAVLNEAMNSGCAVVASSEIGAVPFLMTDGKNGSIYRDGDFLDLYEKTKELCLDIKKRTQFGKEAYQTVSQMWNPENAVERFMFLLDDIQKNGTSDRFSTGPCSKAEIIRDGWYK